MLIAVHNGEQSALQSDTAPEVEREWIRHVAQLTEAHRAREAFLLTDDVRKRVWAAVSRAYPTASQSELDWRYAEQVYGRDIAERVKRWSR